MKLLAKNELGELQYKQVYLLKIKTLKNTYRLVKPNPVGNHCSWCISFIYIKDIHMPLKSFPHMDIDPAGYGINWELFQLKDTKELKNVNSIINSNLSELIIDREINKLIIKGDKNNMNDNYMSELMYKWSFFAKDSKNEESISTTINSITVNENKKVVTVVFSDGKVQMAKCSEDDTFDVSVGVAMCLAYQLFKGSKSAFRKEIESKSKKVIKNVKKLKKAKKDNK